MCQLVLLLNQMLPSSHLVLLVAPKQMDHQYLLPPLVLTQEEAREAIEKFEAACETAKSALDKAAST